MAFICCRLRQSTSGRCLPIAAFLLGLTALFVSGCVKDVPYQLNQSVLAPQLELPPKAPRSEPPNVRKPQVQNHYLVVAPLEIDRAGKLFQCTNALVGTNCQVQRAIDHIAQARAEINQTPGQKLVVLAYIHG